MMNNDMPWVDLTPEEVQELRNKKHELTEYGKQKIRELMTHEEKSEAGKKGGKIIGKINGKKSYEAKIGIHGRTKEQRVEDARKGGLIGGSKGGKKTNSQKWMCEETGYISNPGALSKYQRKRGIDTSKRRRLS